jgi:DNA-binding GntR family transcriptional regulator
MLEKMAKDSAEPSVDEARQSAKTLVEFAYNQIREQILTGKLEAGSKLKVEVLRAQFAVGASTMREALSLLIADALVTAEGQRGFRVAPISLEDLQDITNMRKLLECRALRESIENGSEEWEAGVVAAYHRLSRVEDRLYEDPAGTAAEWEIRNRAFHDALLAGCQSKWLHHFHNILYDQAVRYRRMILAAPQIGRDVRKEHEQILDAVLRRDADAACALTEDHIERTLSAVSALMRAKEAEARSKAPRRRGAND